MKDKVWHALMLTVFVLLDTLLLSWKNWRTSFLVLTRYLNWFEKCQILSIYTIGPKFLDRAGKVVSRDSWNSEKASQPRAQLTIPLFLYREEGEEVAFLDSFVMVRRWKTRFDLLQELQYLLVLEKQQKMLIQRTLYLNLISYFSWSPHYLTSPYL